MGSWMKGARELAQARANATLLDRRETQRTEDARAIDERRAVEQRTTSIVTAVEDWEARTRKADPDYAKKSDLVQAKCQAIVQRTGKPPMTAEEAIALADQALSEVNALFKSALPKPRPVSPAPPGTSTTVAARPASLRAAIEEAARGH